MSCMIGCFEIDHGNSLKTNEICYVISFAMASFFKEIDGFNFSQPAV